MSVKIWDSASQAFVEPQNVPRRYDAENGAFVDTTGKVYDADAAAWAEKWGSYKNILPYMTSNTSPYNSITVGENTGIRGYLSDGSLGGSTPGTQYAYCGFTSDGEVVKGITYIYSTSNLKASVIYKFDEKHYVKRIKAMLGGGDMLFSTKFNIYLDGTLEHSTSYKSVNGNYIRPEMILENAKLCSEIKFEFITTKNGDWYFTGFNVSEILGR